VGPVRPAVTYLLDTNAIIYHLQGAAELDSVFSEISEGAVEPAVSVVTQIELLGFPQISPREEAAINSLLRNFTIADVDRTIAERAVGLRRKYGLKLPDAIIAATALVLDACLVSRDVDLKRVRGLRLLNPFAS
jgi:predicted nucleic acid-binding protein